MLGTTSIQSELGPNLNGRVLMESPEIVGSGNVAEVFNEGGEQCITDDTTGRTT